MQEFWQWMCVALRNTKYVGAGHIPYYKNKHSARNEHRHLNIILLYFCYFIRAATPTSSLQSVLFTGTGIYFCIICVMKVKSRTFVVVVMATFLAINIFNVNYVFLNILFKVSRT